MKVEQYVEDGIPEATVDCFVEQTRTKCPSPILFNPPKDLYNS
jgi:hypothetical protein